jgi:hypothetical protein
MSSEPTNEELLQVVEVQYRTIMQMNRLLTEMVEQLRDRGMVRELLQMQMRVDDEEQPRHEHRPTLLV